MLQQGHSLKHARTSAIALKKKRMLGPRGGVLKKPIPRVLHTDFVARGMVV